MFPAGLGIKTWFATNQNNKKTRFPKNQQQIVVLCGTAYEYPFLLYVKFTNWTKKTKKQNKKNHHTPILVLKYKTKTKHTHLKRCLYYNHLPQNLKNLQPTEITTNKALLKLWLSQNKFLEQDPNADDYEKYSVPLGREDTNEEIIEKGTEDT